MRICIIVASLGRPQVLSELLGCLESQTYLPSLIIFSVTRKEDLPEITNSRVKVLLGPKGASVQRNRGLDFALPRCDIVVFLDDDFVPDNHFLENVRSTFARDTTITGATGHVIADGVGKGGIDFSTAVELLRAYSAKNISKSYLETNICTAYGCNMAFRSAAISEERFDENLPFHSWQEDVDFGARVAQIGRMIYTDRFAGVHRGVTTGRGSGRRVGYSQIANPIYLLKKGTIKPRHASKIMIKNLLINHLRVLSPEPHIDRWGRTLGNWKAIIDLFRGRLHPRNIENFS